MAGATQPSSAVHTEVLAPQQPQHEQQQSTPQPDQDTTQCPICAFIEAGPCGEQHKVLICAAAYSFLAAFTWHLLLAAC
jgi:hypothetical protein